MRVGQVGRSVGTALLEGVGRLAGHLGEQRHLQADTLESDEEYLVVFDAPGAEPRDVQVRYVGDAVEVRIDRFREFREGFEMRFPGRGLVREGRATLPGDARIDADHSTARLREDGTLYVFVRKADGESETEGEHVAVGDAPGSSSGEEAPANGTGEAETDERAG